MTRREILKYTAAATGVTLSPAFVSAFLSGCTTSTENGTDADSVPGSTPSTPQFFTSKEHEFIRKFIDHVLPKTDSPSATEVGVDLMMDSLVGVVYQKEEQDKVRLDMGMLMDQFDMSDFTGSFNEIAGRRDVQMFNDLKGQTVVLYLSTEEIGKKYLNYLPIPGPYEGCIPLADVGSKKWAI